MFGPRSGYPARLLLALTLLGAAGSVRAQEAGFGGAPLSPARPATPAEPAEPAPSGGSECLVQDEAGNWLPCDLVLEAAADPAPASPAPEPQPAPEPEPSAKEPPRRLSPFEAALAKSREGRKIPPLVALREEVEGLRETIEKLYRDPDRAEERDAKKKELAFLEEVLRHVEEKAHARMRSCLRRRGLPLPAPLKTYRMTPGGLIPLSAAELKAAGPVVDTYPCERVRVIEQELVDNVRRYHALRRRLEEEEFGWKRRDEKAALEKEVSALLDEIEGHDPLRRYRPGVR